MNVYISVVNPSKGVDFTTEPTLSANQYTQLKHNSFRQVFHLFRGP